MLLYQLAQHSMQTVIAHSASYWWRMLTKSLARDCYEHSHPDQTLRIMKQICQQPKQSRCLADIYYGGVCARGWTGRGIVVIVRRSWGNHQRLGVGMWFAPLHCRCGHDREKERSQMFPSWHIFAFTLRWKIKSRNRDLKPPLIPALSSKSLFGFSVASVLIWEKVLQSSVYMTKYR